jgi:hypothetical protein
MGAIKNDNGKRNDDTELKQRQENPNASLATRRTPNHALTECFSPRSIPTAMKALAPKILPHASEALLSVLSDRKIAVDTKNSQKRLPAFSFIIRAT